MKTEAAAGRRHWVGARNYNAVAADEMIGAHLRLLALKNYRCIGGIVDYWTH